MALIDFYGLAALYELRCSDVDFPSIPSRSPMSSARSSRSPSPLAEPDEAQLPFYPTRTEFKTPERKRGTSHSVSIPDLTPLSLGSAMRRTQEAGADKVGKFERADYDAYIREDLRNRVFVDFEVFMTSVLHVPEDWRTTWGPAIEGVKTDSGFNEKLKGYYGQCNNPDAAEGKFYTPLIDTANAALGVLPRFTTSDTPAGIPQYYHTNNPKKLRGGVINLANLSPDIVALHEDCHPSERNLHWANPLHVLEVKPYDNAICDGLGVLRMLSQGKTAWCALSVFGHS